MLLLRRWDGSAVGRRRQEALARSDETGGEGAPIFTGRTSERRSAHAEARISEFQITPPCDCVFDPLEVRRNSFSRSAAVERKKG
jgi:hypothetical protein